MKKFFFVSIFFLFTGIASVVAQSFPVNPIPSYNVSLTTLNTGFQEIRPRINPLPSREKRDMEVTISSSSTSSMTIFAKDYNLCIGRHICEAFFYSCLKF